MRQSPISSEPDGAIWVRSMAVRFTTPYASGELRHDWHKLCYASAGVLRVVTPEGAWVAPPHRAVWVPAGVAHREETRGGASVRSLYLASAICGALPSACAVLNVPPLLRELILEVAETSVLDATQPTQRRLAEIIVDRIALLEPKASQVLPMPRDRRALSIAQHLQSEPGNNEPLAILARRSGASVRTAQRLFLSETGMAFAQWRQRLRLLVAMERLGAGLNVTQTAFEVGYASVSAFVSAFRCEFGVTPGQYAES